MSAFEKPLCTPAEIEQQTFFPSTTLRDWRSKDYGKKFGKAGESGRYLYSAREVVEFAIIMLALRSGTDNWLALKIGETCAASVFHYWGVPVSPEPKRFTYFYRRAPLTYASPIDQKWSHDWTDDLSDMSDFIRSLCFVFDAEKFAREYESIKTFLKRKMGAEDE